MVAVFFSRGDYIEKVFGYTDLSLPVRRIRMQRCGGDRIRHTHGERRGCDPGASADSAP